MHALFRIAPWVLLAVMSCGDKSGTTDTVAEATTPNTSSPSAVTEDEGLTTSTGGTTSTSGPTTGQATSETTIPGGDPTSDPTFEPTAGMTSGPVTATEPVTSSDTSSGESSSESSSGTAASCDGDKPRVRLKTTLGDMVLELDVVNAPITVANFVDYVESGFYVDTIFHRVIDGFVIQGGGLTAGLQEKPGNAPIVLETSPQLTHVNGAISMARTNDPNSATSQFFICDGPQNFLDGQYAAFGVVVEGLDVLAQISAVPTTTKGQYEGVPVDDVVVLAADCE